MVNDIIGDSLARIRNGLSRQKGEVTLLHSKIVEDICKILTDQGFLGGYEVKELEGNKKEILVKLNYQEDEKNKVITKLTRVSRPGLRIYKGYKELKPVLNGYGICIVTTPKGVLTDIEARKNKTGGEVLCRIY